MKGLAIPIFGTMLIIVAIIVLFLLFNGTEYMERSLIEKGELAISVTHDAELMRKMAEASLDQATVRSAYELGAAGGGFATWSSNGPNYMQPVDGDMWTEGGIVWPGAPYWVGDPECSPGYSGTIRHVNSASTMLWFISGNTQCNISVLAPMDLSKFEKIVFWDKAQYTTIRPVNMSLELYSSSGDMEKKANVTFNTSDDWERIEIDLDDFDDYGIDLYNVTTIKVIAEDPMILYIDGFRFESDQLTGTLTAKISTVMPSGKKELSTLRTAEWGSMKLDYEPCYPLGESRCFDVDGSQELIIKEERIFGTASINTSYHRNVSSSYLRLLHVATSIVDDYFWNVSDNRHASIIEYDNFHLFNVTDLYGASAEKCKQKTKNYYFSGIPGSYWGTYISDVVPFAVLCGYNAEVGLANMSDYSDTVEVNNVITNVSKELNASFSAKWPELALNFTKIEWDPASSTAAITWRVMDPADLIPIKPTETAVCPTAPAGFDCLYLDFLVKVEG